MSAGDCVPCGGDGFVTIGVLVEEELGITKRWEKPCPFCDGTGKAGYRRITTRIRDWFRKLTKGITMTNSNKNEPVRHGAERPRNSATIIVVWAVIIAYALIGVGVWANFIWQNVAR